MRVAQRLSSSNPPALVLGRGYVAQELLRASPEQFCVTSRGGSTLGTGTCDQPMYFNLTDTESWSVVDSFESVVWTFPAAQSAAEIESSLKFFETKRMAKKKVLILASTSAYLVSAAGALVDETYPLNLCQPRVRAEEELRDRGACILHLAGIYGPGRDPLNWLQRGLIKSPNSFINLIHSSDICRIVMSWLSSDGLSERRINASDGRYRTWSQLIDELKTVGLLDQSFELNSDLGTHQHSPSKRVSNDLLLKVLYSGPFHRYPEEGLERS